MPGFTPQRIEEWLETYPAEVLGLPSSTGSPIPADPSGNVIFTPIPQEVGPTIVEAREGEPTPILPSYDQDTVRGIQRENDSAKTLRQNGYDIVQNPFVDGEKRPDYMINGKIYDHYAPETPRARNIWSAVKGKVEDRQAPNIVIGLQDGNVDEVELRKQFEQWPIEGLEDVIIIRRDGTIGRF